MQTTLPRLIPLLCSVAFSFATQAALFASDANPRLVRLAPSPATVAQSAPSSASLRFTSGTRSIFEDSLRRFWFGSQMIDWKPLAALVDGLYTSKVGRPAWPGAIMIKMCVLQQFYNLSDPELEVQAANRLSFRSFIGIGIADKAPDETTMVRFRERLRDAKLDSQIFDSINNQLMTRGFIVRQATIIDATPFQANEKPPFGDREATDPDAKFTVKAGKPHYGYKLHVAVDADHGVIRGLAFTPANTHDSTQTEALVPDDASMVLAEKAYFNKATVDHLAGRNMILYKAFRNHPLTAAQESVNRAASSVRARIETLLVSRSIGLDTPGLDTLRSAQTNPETSGAAFPLTY